MISTGVDHAPLQRLVGLRRLDERWVHADRLCLGAVDVRGHARLLAPCLVQRARRFLAQVDVVREAARCRDERDQPWSRYCWTTSSVKPHSSAPGRSDRSRPVRC